VGTAGGGLAGRADRVGKRKRPLTTVRYGRAAMAQTTKRKPAIKWFGYGALALYALGILAMAVGVYGFNVSSLVSRLHESERLREQLRSGRMVVVNKDRDECRTYRFDNVTADVTAEKMEGCENFIMRDGKGNAGFNSFQRSFQKQ
jgi:hypothetical protein